MKWMLHDNKKKELSFLLEEHEIVEEMEHHIYFDQPETNAKDAKRVQLSAGPARVNSEWVLKFKVPEQLQLHVGQVNFYVSGNHPLKGNYIIAS